MPRIKKKWNTSDVPSRSRSISQHCEARDGMKWRLKSMTDDTCEPLVTIPTYGPWSKSKSACFTSNFRPLFIRAFLDDNGCSQVPQRVKGGPCEPEEGGTILMISGPSGSILNAV